MLKGFKINKKMTGRVVTCGTLLVSITCSNFLESGSIQAQEAPSYHELLHTGRGIVTDMAQQPGGDLLAVSGNLGIWLYEDNLQSVEHLEDPKWSYEEDEWIESVAWSPDGYHLASISRKPLEQLQLWDINTGQNYVLSSSEMGYTDFYSVAWRPDGSILASSSNSGKVDLWDVATGKRLDSLQLRDSPVWAIAWNPTGSLLAVTSRNGTVHIWEPTSQRILNSIRFADNYLTESLAWHPDGIHLAISDVTGKIHLWDTTSTNVISLEGHTGEVTSLAWDSDGKYLASAGIDGRVQVWNAAGQALITLQEGGSPIRSVVWGNEGKTLISASMDHILRTWDVDTKQVLFTTEGGHTGNITSVVWSPDGKYLATGSHDLIQFPPFSVDNTVRLWNPANGQETTLFQQDYTVTSGIKALAWNPDGNQLAIGKVDGHIWIWGVLQSQVVADLKQHDEAVISLAWHSNGRYLASAGRDGTVRLWDFATHQSHIIWKSQSPLYLIIWRPGSDQLTIASLETVSLWDMTTDSTVKTLPLKVLSLGWSRDGSHLAVGDLASLRIWDSTTGDFTELAKMQALSVDWSPVGNWLAAAGIDGRIYIWETERITLSLEPAVVISDFLDLLPPLAWQRTISIAWSPDGEMLAAGTNRGVLEVWNIRTT